MNIIGFVPLQLDISSDLRQKLDNINHACDDSHQGKCPTCGGGISMSNSEFSVCVNGHTALSIDFRQKR